MSTNGGARSPAPATGRRATTGDDGCRYGAAAADVVMTTQGGAGVARAVRETGRALLGIPSHKNVPSGYTVDFVDWPFEESAPSWNTHKAVVRRNRPRYAVAPDVERGRSLERVIDLADELRQYADCVIVVPKEVAPAQIPDRFRVGLPFQPNFGTGGVEIGQQTLGAATGNTVRDFAGPDVGGVHVLGGAPHDQLRIPDFDVDVRSVDTSLPLLYGRFGDVWFQEGRVEMDDLSLYERIEATLRNMLIAWGHSGVEPTLTLQEAIEQALEDLAEMDEFEIRRRMRRGPPLVDPEGPSGPIREGPGFIPEAIDVFVRNEISPVLE